MLQACSSREKNGLQRKRLRKFRCFFLFWMIIFSRFDGNFRLPGPNRLSFVKKGSYYDLDQGAELDVFIRDYRNFFDRKALTEIVNGLR